MNSKVNGCASKGERFFPTKEVIIIYFFNVNKYFSIIKTEIELQNIW